MLEHCMTEVCLVDVHRDKYLPLCTVLSEIANTCSSKGVRLDNWRCGTPCGGYTSYIMHYTLYAIHYTLYSKHYTLYTIHYTLYTIHYTLYTIHYTAGLLWWWLDHALFYSLIVYPVKCDNIQLTNKHFRSSIPVCLHARSRALDRSRTQGGSLKTAGL